MTTTKNNEHKKLNVPNSTDRGNVIRNVPHLRFPEFEGEWKDFLINDVCSEFKSGKNIKADSISENGEFPVYGGNGLRGYTSSYNHEGLYVLIGRQGALCGNVRSVHGKTFITEHAIAVAGNEISNTSFLHYLFVKMNLGQYSDQSAQPGLAVNKLLKIKVVLPSVSEQTKIARFLSLLDERITTQNKIIEDLKKLKSAISKKLLCNDKWTTCIIQDIAEIGRGRVISSVEIDRQKHPLYPVYSSQTSNNGIMGYLDNYMFDGEYITWTTDGANAGTVFYRKGKFNCTNVCGTLKIQPKFDCYFVSLVLQQATQKYVSSNLANPKLMNNTMASIKIRMPNIETQKQLSKVFQTLDSCLLVHQRTCKMYLSEKQYLLRQMFI